jgi:hypothetical protein
MGRVYFWAFWKGSLYPVTPSISHIHDIADGPV